MTRLFCKRLADFLVTLLPYGVAIGLRQRMHCEREDVPLFFYKGWAKRLRRIVKFSLPYFLVHAYRNSSRCQRMRLKKALLSEWKIKPVAFPLGAVAVTKELSAPVPNGRTAIFACFFQDGHIRASTLYYLEHLGDVVDNVIVVGDCPVCPSEVSRLPDIVRYCSFSRHGEYDFGSYKRGYEYAINHPVLQTSRELLLCNDSCYGPVTPFGKVFEKMENVHCDFWGLCENRYYQRHLQSYFLLLMERVWKSKRFGAFMRSVRKESSIGAIILKYEIGLTRALEDEGFVGKCAFALDEQLHGDLELLNPTQFPIELMSKGCPLVKVKALHDVSCNLEGIKETISVIRAHNETLGKMLENELDENE